MFGRKKPPQDLQRIDNPLLVAIKDRDPNGPLTVHIGANQLQDANTCGLILADIAKHFAKALTATGKATGEIGALAEMRFMFLAEMDSPTEAATGGIVQ